MGSLGHLTFYRRVTCIHTTYTLIYVSGRYLLLLTYIQLIHWYIYPGVICYMTSHDLKISGKCSWTQRISNPLVARYIAVLKRPPC